MRSAFSLAALLLVPACGAPAPEGCGDTCDSSSRGEDPAYVPYRWCTDVASEADRIRGTYTCTSEEVDLRGETVTLLVEPVGELAESLTVTGVEVEECVEVVAWDVDLTFSSEAFSAFLPSRAEVYVTSDSALTELFNDLYAREAIDGWLFDGEKGAQAISVVSHTPVGESGKVWEVSLGNFDEAVLLSCE